MDEQDKCCYEFGSFRLNPAEHTLRHKGKVVSLPPKDFETLLTLVTHHGHLVKKDELLDAVWADTFVEEGNVAKHVSELRKLLSRNGSDKEFIETVPTLGYRFVAPLEEIGDEAPSQVERKVSDSSTIQPTRTKTTQSSTNLEYALDQARSHKLAAILIFAALLTVMTAAGYYFVFSGRAPVVTDKDVVLLIDFENKTGEEIFDGTLKNGLMIQLQQSPLLSIYPERGVRKALKLMKRNPDELLTKKVGIEICQRQGLKALIAGKIVKFDRNYLLTLEAINSRTQETIAIIQVEAKGKDQVLTSLSKAATEMRKKLGKSLALIEEYDKPPPQMATPSL